MSVANSQIVKHVKKSKLRNAEYYHMQDTLDMLHEQSKNGSSFRNLMSMISSSENIKLAYRNIKKNTGSKTAGVDGRTIEHISKLTEEQFVGFVRNKLRDYKPKAVRRVEIPKPNGKIRPLGIPAIWDRIVQQCILQILEPIVEAKFSGRSHGFRPNRSVENAIAQSYRLMQNSKMSYVIDIDIKGFFDNVSHAKLLKQMWAMGIQDKNLLTIISKMLKAKIKLPDGQIIENEKGTPQGGILSPLLSNIVLNELDRWIESQWEDVPTKKDYLQYHKKKNNHADKGYKYRMLRKSKLKECYIVRYADDFKIFCSNPNHAKRLFIAVQNWLKERLGLEISEDKSKIVNLKKGYSEFLGFKMKLIPKGDKWIVKSHMCDQAVRRTKKNLKQIINGIRHDSGVNDQARKIALYNSTVIGLHQYFRTATMISEDMGNIAYEVNACMKDHRMKRRIKKTGVITSDFIKKEYGKSKQLRFISRDPLLPIGYIKHKNPMMKRNTVNAYTKEGREEIHKNLTTVDINILRFLMEHPIPQRSIEYNDNRIALYCAQRGKCHVTGQMLNPMTIHCHHKVPRLQGGTDQYNNLCLVDKEIHILIHAIDEEIILKYKKLLTNSQSLNKINTLRKKLELQQLTI
ncbi:group II intron reverse transcriptase/maturase [Sporosarcina ureae]|uniref:Group II intron reverse transcriptase/maturase n=1 Tax=Sporosarcina ureae TaxID=1571 RepID=A0ABN4YLK9_SPOUR|nr:group II intron reverse transcriptase/maturase [Sporosarcina ureae]ARF12764.1 group II intron reverse transcriptase/maturase [Sporosarcina ureae]ARF12770.1 group II intron reverse transcriptase/maturase [Sporosarcina ureae]ARF13056.1 group II intron reverse transcriptase/maturase [Sporosarcina ureae]